MLEQLGFRCLCSDRLGLWFPSLDTSSLPTGKGPNGPLENTQVEDKHRVLGKILVLPAMSCGLGEAMPTAKAGLPNLPLWDLVGQRTFNNSARVKLRQPLHSFHGRIR